MSTPLTEHFTLEELIPSGMDADHVPADVRENLEQLALNVLEPVRAHFGLPVIIHSGWRPSTLNAATPGSSGTSDHVAGRAADFHVADGPGVPWEANTLAAFEFIRTALDGAYGQLIREDHRVKLASPGKLWIHVAIPGPKHGGFAGDPNRVLVSSAPKHYEPWKEPLA